MSEIEIINKLMNNLDALDVNSTLDNPSFVNAICSVFLNYGKRLFYVWGEGKTGWLYFDEYALVAAYTEAETDQAALNEITRWSTVNVKEYRNIDIVEYHFQISISEFMHMINKKATFNELCSVSGDLSDYFVNIDLLKGFVCLMSGKVVAEHNLNSNLLDIDYFLFLVKFSDKDHGIFLKLKYTSEKSSFYLLKENNRVWIFCLKNQSCGFANFAEVEEKLMAPFHA